MGLYTSRDQAQQSPFLLGLLGQHPDGVLLVPENKKRTPMLIHRQTLNYPVRRLPTQTSRILALVGRMPNQRMVLLGPNCIRQTDAQLMAQTLVYVLSLGETLSSAQNTLSAQGTPS